MAKKIALCITIASSVVTLLGMERNNVLAHNINQGQVASSLRLLFQACVSGNVAMATQALNTGANPDLELNIVARPEQLSIITSYLHLAAARGHHGIVEQLLLYGAFIDPKDNNAMTPLGVAILTNQLAVVELLIKEGANLESRNKFGYTPLALSLFECNVLLTRKLIKAGTHTNDIGGPIIGSGLHCLLYELVPQNEDQALDIIELLRCSDTELDVQNRDGSTPFHLTANNPRLVCSLLAPLAATQVAHKRKPRTRCCFSYTSIASGLRTIMYGREPVEANSISLKTKAQERLFAFLCVNYRHELSNEGPPSLPPEVVYRIFSHLPTDCKYGELEHKIVTQYMSEKSFRRRFLNGCLTEMHALINTDTSGISQRKLVRVLQRVNNQQKTAAEIATDPVVQLLLNPRTWLQKKE